jgi:hypothetical protein
LSPQFFHDVPSSFARESEEVTNANLVEVTANLAEILPVAQTAGTVLSASFTMAEFRHVVAEILVGTPGSGGTVNAQFLASATSGGTYAAVPGTAIAQVSAAGIARIEMRGDRVNALGVGPYFKLQVVVAVATTPIAATVTGADCRTQPASLYNDAAVVSPDIVL